MSSVRMVRPRPLGDEERIPVFWPGREPGAALKAIDAGALYRCLLAQNSPARQGAAAGSSRKRQRREPEYKAPLQGHDTGGHFGAPATKKRATIALPTVREVKDYAANKAAQGARPQAAPGEGFLTSPYVRYEPPTTALCDETDGTEYVMDDVDEAFLERMNGPTGHGGGAASSPRGARGGGSSASPRAAAARGGGRDACSNGQRGLVAAAVGLYQSLSMRLGRNNSGSAAGGVAPGEAASQPSPARQGAAASGPQAAASTPGGAQSCNGSAPALLLDPDTFEAMMDALEMAHMRSTKEWWERTSSDAAPAAAGGVKLPKVPANKLLLPRVKALELLADVQTGQGAAGGQLPEPERRWLLGQVYDWWLLRRGQEGGPLIARLWFEQPWKLLGFKGLLDSEDADADEQLPFVASVPRSAGGRRGGRARRLSDGDAIDALVVIRNELERVRTLADQVRRREKVKRQLLLLWRREWLARLAVQSAGGAAECEAAPAASRHGAATGGGGGHTAPGSAAATPGVRTGRASAAAVAPPPLEAAAAQAAAAAEAAAAAAEAAAAAAEAAAAPGARRGSGSRRVQGRRASTAAAMQARAPEAATAALLARPASGSRRTRARPASAAAAAPALEAAAVEAAAPPPPPAGRPARRAAGAVAAEPAAAAAVAPPVGRPGRGPRDASPPRAATDERTGGTARSSRPRARPAPGGGPPAARSATPASAGKEASRPRKRQRQQLAGVEGGGAAPSSAAARAGKEGGSTQEAAPARDAAHGSRRAGRSRGRSGGDSGSRPAPGGPGAPEQRPMRRQVGRRAPAPQAQGSPAPHPQTTATSEASTTSWDSGDSEWVATDSSDGEDGEADGLEGLEDEVEGEGAGLQRRQACKETRGGVRPGKAAEAQRLRLRSGRARELQWKWEGRQGTVAPPREGRQQDARAQSVSGAGSRAVRRQSGARFSALPSEQEQASWQRDAGKQWDAGKQRRPPASRAPQQAAGGAAAGGAAEAAGARKRPLQQVQAVAAPGPGGGLSGAALPPVPPCKRPAPQPMQPAPTQPQRQAGRQLAARLRVRQRQRTAAMAGLPVAAARRLRSAGVDEPKQLGIHA